MLLWNNIQKRTEVLLREENDGSMRNGKNILRMQADEEDVYHLMDLKERYFVLIGAGSFIEGIAAIFSIVSDQMLGSYISVCVHFSLGFFFF